MDNYPPGVTGREPEIAGADEPLEFDDFYHEVQDPMGETYRMETRQEVEDWLKTQAIINTLLNLKGDRS